MCVHHICVNSPTQAFIILHINTKYNRQMIKLPLIVNCYTSMWIANDGKLFK